jgi:hypothetical protein
MHIFPADLRLENPLKRVLISGSSNLAGFRADRKAKDDQNAIHTFQ